MAKILALFHAGTGLLLEIMTAPLRSHEMASVTGVHSRLEQNDILVADRGFCSFAHLGLLALRKVHAVFRMHQKQIIDFTLNRPHADSTKKSAKGLPRSRWVRSLGVMDQVVEWFKPAKRPDWMTAEQYAELPDTLLLRELRYQTGGAGFRAG